MTVKISQIKHDLASDIEEYLVSAVQEMKTLVSANERPRNFRGKYICRVNNADEAAKITDEINRLCREATDTASRNGAKLTKPIVYDISTIRTMGRIHMAFSDAKSVSIVKGADIESRIKSSIDISMTASAEDAKGKMISRENILDEVREAISEGRILRDHEYRLVRHSGTSYRITYYNMEKDAREQVSVGDILIFVTDTPLGDYVPTFGKRRSDVAFGESICGCGAWVVMEIDKERENTL